jgi:hypothetical protein
MPVEPGLRVTALEENVPKNWGPLIAGTPDIALQ